MYKIIIIIILSASLVGGATIKGIVKDTERNELIVYANVFLKMHDFKKGLSTNNNGSFEINDLSIGKYNLIISHIGYPRYELEITIDSVNQVIELKINLEVLKILVPIVPEIEKYHSQLNSLCQSDVLKIHLDSLKYKKSLLTVYSTFENLSTIPIYVIKTVDCLRMVDVNYSNDYIPPTPIKVFFFDCMGMKDNPDSSTFLIIPPQSKVTYSPVTVYTRRFYDDNYKYSISLTYSYNRKTMITGIHSNPDIEYYNKRYKKAYYYYNMAFRGKVESSNVLEVDVIDTSN